VTRDSHPSRIHRVGEAFFLPFFWRPTNKQTNKTNKQTNKQNKQTKPTNKKRKTNKTNKKRKQNKLKQTNNICYPNKEKIRSVFLSCFSKISNINKWRKTNKTPPTNSGKIFHSPLPSPSPLFISCKKNKTKKMVFHKMKKMKKMKVKSFQFWTTVCLQDGSLSLLSLSSFSLFFFSLSQKFSPFLSFALHRKQEKNDLDTFLASSETVVLASGFFFLCVCAWVNYGMGKMR